MDDDTRDGGHGLVRVCTYSETVWGTRRFRHHYGWESIASQIARMWPGLPHPWQPLVIDTRPVPELAIEAPLTPEVEAQVREAARRAQAEAVVLWGLLAGFFGPPPERVECPWADGTLFIAGVGR